MRRCNMGRRDSSDACPPSRAAGDIGQWAAGSRCAGSAASRRPAGGARIRLSQVWRAAASTPGHGRLGKMARRCSGVAAAKWAWRSHGCAERHMTDALVGEIRAAAAVARMLVAGRSRRGACARSAREAADRWEAVLEPACAGRTRGKAGCSCGSGTPLRAACERSGSRALLPRTVWTVREDLRQRRQRRAVCLLSAVHGEGGGRRRAGKKGDVLVRDAVPRQPFLYGDPQLTADKAMHPTQRTTPTWFLKIYLQGALARENGKHSRGTTGRERLGCLRTLLMADLNGRECLADPLSPFSVATLLRPVVSSPAKG